MRDDADDSAQGSSNQPPGDTPPPGASPPSGAPPPGDTPPRSSGPPPPMGPPGRPGLAWERRDELGIATALLQTIREVLFSPTEAFARMKAEGGWGEPLGFAVVVGSVSIWVWQAWSLLTRSLLVGVPGFETQDIAAANVQEVWMALIAPLQVVVYTFFFAALVHVLLQMLGSTRYGYESTFRVICYSGAAGAFNLIPVCGVIIGAVWSIVVQIIGIREAHQVPTGRAVAAVLIPVILSCLCIAMLALLVVGVAGLSQMGQMGVQ